MTRVCLVNFVHDEVILECDEDIAIEMFETLTDCLENKVDIGVPTPSEGGICYSKDFEGEDALGFKTGSWMDIH